MERKEAIEVVKKNYPHCAESGTQFETALRTLIPELQESDGERIMKFLHHTFTAQYLAQDKLGKWHGEPVSNILAWLEKQGESDETKAKTFLINKGYPIDANGIFPTYEEMYNIIKEGLEKQGKQQESAKEYTFNAIPRLLEMLQPSSRAKSYCQKLIDSLEQEGYSTDAKIVRERLKIMNGEEVAMATMDEQNPAVYTPKFRVGGFVISTKNPHLTYKVLEVGHINENGEPEYKVEIFVDGQSSNPRNINYIRIQMMDEWGKLIDQPTEWSEEDEEEFQIAIDTLVEAGQHDSANWLKSIKDRVQPQATWKPSDEQMEALEKVRHAFHEKELWSEVNPVVYAYESLIRDLQKLL